MKTVSSEISELKGEFEGGSSFTIDWYVKLRQGGEALLDNIKPSTLMRRVPIYGGLARGLSFYYCPADVDVPSRLHTLDYAQTFEYQPPAPFYAGSRTNKFTIETVNGVRFIVVRHATNGTIVNLNLMNEVGNITGITLAPNTYNVLPGASASLQGTFSDTDFTISEELDTPINVSALMYGVAIVPVFLDAADDVQAIRLRLKTDDTKYLEMTSLQDSVGDFLADGQNMVRFEMAKAVRTGLVDLTDITEWELDVEMKSGKSQIVVIGAMTLQLTHIFFLDYYSRRMFIDGTTGAWKDTPEKGDLINLEREAIGILHYETCRLVIQSATFDRIDSSESTRIDTNLTRKYQAYFLRYPSSEQPLSYNIAPDIGIGLETDPSAFIPDRIGGFAHAENAYAESLQAQQFAANETPTGAVDGTNTSYNLAHTPNPASSLQLYVNGVLQTQGVEYTLSGAVITFASPLAAEYASLPFVAFYRYSLI